VLIFVVASASILLAAVATALLLPRRGTVAFVAAIALLAQAMIVSTVGIAGLLFRTLDGEALLILALAWPVAVGVIAWRRGQRHEGLRAGVPTFGAGASGLRARAAGLRGRACVALSALRPVLRDPAIIVALLLVLGTLAWRTFLALRIPIVDYDGWSYHLVFVDVWIQHNALTLVPQRPWTAGYPADTELLTTWLVAFTHSDALAGFTSILPIPLAIAAATGLARTLGADRRAALLAGLLLAMTPALIALAGTSYVDASSLAMVTATWWLGLRVIRGERDAAAALLLGVAGGLAFGTKGTNLPLVAPILAVAGLALLRDLFNRARTAGAGRHLWGVVLLAIPVLLLGGSWYLKNLLVFGNPLYPLAIGPFGGPVTLAELAVATPPEVDGRGLLGQLAAGWLKDWERGYYIYNHRPGGFGRAWPILAVLAAGGIALLIRRQRVAALGLVVLPAIVLLATMPMPWYARLTLFVPGMGLPLAALALSAAPSRIGRVAGLVIVGVAAISLAIVNGRPNVDIRSATGESGGWPPPVAYLGYLLDPSAERRATVSLRAECAGFAVIPPGDKVAPGGFNLLHGPVGPDLDRILTRTVSGATSAAELESALRAVGARWLVVQTGSALDRVAAMDPERFLAHGEICRSGSLWELRSG
jgi:hypothetical protein